MEADSDMMGSDIQCPSCGKQVRIPLHVFSINPFQRPIHRLTGTILSIEWQMPFFPQFIEAVVLVFVILVTAGLYLTIGIASQVAGIFQSLMLDAQHEIKTGSLVEKSAYAVAGGIYVVLWLPFWLLLLPFTLLGWLWKHLGYMGLAIMAVILALVCLLAWKPNLITSLFLHEPPGSQEAVTPAAYDTTRVPLSFGPPSRPTR